MDSFMDKIAEKFGTTDVIKANSEAEAKELQNAKARIAELEKAVAEMRRLSLKCVETNELTTQVIQASLEKIEEIKANETEASSQDVSAELEAVVASISELKESIAESFKEQEEVIHKEDVRVYRNVQAAIIDELKQQSEAIAIQHKHIESRMKGIKPISIIALVFSGISMISIIAISILVILTMGL